MGTTKQWNLYMLRDRLGHLRLDELTKSRLSTFFRERAENKGPDYVKLGKSIFYRKQDVLDWINANVVLTRRQV